MRLDALDWVKGKFGFAAGGSVPRTGSYLVGELGPEIINMRGGDHVTPNHTVAAGARLAAGGDPGGTRLHPDDLAALAAILNSRPVQLHVELDGREIATNSRRHALRDVAARSTR